MSLVLLDAPEAAQINVAGNMYNCRFQGMNLSANDVTSINVGGDIINRGAFTSIDLSQVAGAQPPDLFVLPYAIGSNPSAATLAASFYYGPTTQLLTYQNIPGTSLATVLQQLQQLTIQVYSNGIPQWANPPNDTVPLTTVVSVMNAADANALLELYNALGAAPSGAFGYSIGGGGQFNISARNLDLGTTTGINSLGVGLYSVSGSYPLANYFTNGADISVNLTSNLVMYSTAIASLNGGNIHVNAEGDVNIGSEDYSIASTSPRGIYSGVPGGISVVAGGNVIVNGSRIAAYNGGNIAVSSLDGNVNIGDGGMGSVHTEFFCVDPSTHQVTVFALEEGFPGSGILATTFPTNAPPPPAVVGNITIAAAQNILLGCNAITQMPLDGTSGNGAVITLHADGNIYISNNGDCAAVVGSGSVNITAGGVIIGVTTLPMLTITAPTAGLQVSNANYTITGTAVDMVTVTNVFYALNNSGWTPATTANHWTNWSAPVTLIPGTNTIAAYAVDTNGNFSLTNSVSLDYVLNTVLTVRTNGHGTISPNYNGAWLPIGQSYTMTATASAGYGFLGWTGSSTTNGATLAFVMASNLTFTANFIIVTNPTLAITAPVARQRWSNELFTVTGTARDNLQVSNVWFQVNSNGWQLATTGNKWTNWTAAASLSPGTNIVNAYALDTCGNLSTVGNVSFDFVVTNQLRICASGLGAVSPNYSNAWLELGRNYSITSTPASGFVFTNWLVSTNWLGGINMSKTNLQFMMASNLTLQAKFVDVARPTNTITAPIAGQHMTNALATVVGIARDNWKVAGVWYQLNNGAWNATTTTNGWTNWTTTLQLIAGSNTVKAYAMDWGGNFSTTNSLSVVSSNTFKLQLAFTNAPPLKTNGLVFSLQLSTGLNGHIQISTNLISWATLTNFVGTNTTITFLDPAATNSNCRFYRATIP